MTHLAQTLILGLLIGGVYALMASGLTLIFGVMKVINVAQGALLILAALFTFELWTRTGMDPLVAILITTPIMFALGWLIYREPFGLREALAMVVIFTGVAAVKRFSLKTPAG